MSFRCCWNCRSVIFTLDEIYDAADKLELVKIVDRPVCWMQRNPHKTYNVFCEDGHIICSSCRAGNERCLQCGSRNVCTRNHVAESIVMSFVFKCKYRDEGCNKLVPWVDLPQHVNHECDFRYGKDNSSSNRHSKIMLWILLSFRLWQ